MIRASIILIRDDSNNRHDDVIHIRDSDVHELVHVDYKAYDLSTTHRATMTVTGLADYLDATLELLTRDADPFYQLQLNTAIHPSILYDVDDLHSSNLRLRIRRAAIDAVRTRVEVLHR